MRRGLFDKHPSAICANGRYVARLDARADVDEPSCPMHVYDRDTPGRYRRTSCPDELAAEPEGGRPH